MQVYDLDTVVTCVKLLHPWIILAIVKQPLVQIGRIDGPTEYLSEIVLTMQVYDLDTVLTCVMVVRFYFLPRFYGVLEPSTLGNPKPLPSKESRLDFQVIVLFVRCHLFARK